MYTLDTSKQSSSSRRGRTGRPHFGGGHPKRSNKGHSPRRGGSSSRRKFEHKKIDVRRYINTSVVTEEQVVFTPKHTFSDFHIDERIKKNIAANGYVYPTPIQDHAIPEVLKGLDVVGIANTGTGKTAAFLLPLIDKVIKGKNEQVLVVAPTRELAQQIEEELKKFTKGFAMYSTCCVGGAPIGKQLRSLYRFNNFVIGTPGRIKDIIERKALDLSKFKTVVLDEADRMLDMGFIHDMKFFMSKMPKERHTLFFSATLSSDIERLIGDFLVNPVRISVKTQDTSKNIHQDIIQVNGKDKMDILHDLLTGPEFKKVLIFGRTKHGVEKISKMLVKRGFTSSSIHGNKTQSQRQRALGDFKNNKLQVLVATDVAARGLDIANVTHVINYDIPSTHEDYIHRIGRTGRGDQKGKALTFVD